MGFHTHTYGWSLLPTAGIAVPTILFVNLSVITKLRCSSNEREVPNYFLQESGKTKVQLHAPTLSKARFLQRWEEGFKQSSWSFWRRVADLQLLPQQLEIDLWSLGRLKSAVLSCR